MSHDMDMDMGSACTSIDQRNSQMQGSDPFNAHVEEPAQKLSYCTQISREQFTAPAARAEDPDWNSHLREWVEAELRDMLCRRMSLELATRIAYWLIGGIFGFLGLALALSIGFTFAYFTSLPLCIDELAVVHGYVEGCETLDHVECGHVDEDGQCFKTLLGPSSQLIGFSLYSISWFVAVYALTLILPPRIAVRFTANVVLRYDAWRCRMKHNPSVAHWHGHSAGAERGACKGLRYRLCCTPRGCALGWPLPAALLVFLILGQVPPTFSPGKMLYLCMLLLLVGCQLLVVDVLTCFRLNLLAPCAVCEPRPLNRLNQSQVATLSSTMAQSSSGPGLDLLVFSCSPADNRLPEAADELRQLQQAVVSSHVASSGTADMLRLQLRNTPPKWFLFSGHGDLAGGALAFTTGEGTTVPVEPGILASILSSCRRLELVVLNGCETLELGRALVDAGVPIVLCWRTKVLDPAAAMFSVDLFLALARDLPNADLQDHYHRAYEQAKVAVQTHVRPKGRFAGSRRFELREPEEEEELKTRDKQGLPIGAGIPEFLMPRASQRSSLTRGGLATTSCCRGVP